MYDALRVWHTFTIPSPFTRDGTFVEASRLNGAKARKYTGKENATAKPDSMDDTATRLQLRRAQPAYIGEDASTPHSHEAAENGL